MDETLDQSATRNLLGETGFRRSLLKPQALYLAPTEQYTEPSESGGRPAQLFTTRWNWEAAGAPVRRSRRTRTTNTTEDPTHDLLPHTGV